MPFLALLFIAATSLSGCFSEAPIEGAQCNKERRCPGEYLCQGARCQGGSPYVQSLLCEADADCRVGSRCHPVDGLCVQCYEDRHCLTGRCTSDSSCAPCELDAHCASTGRCNAYGYCASCLVDSDCAPGTSCLQGLGQCETLEEDQRGDPGSVRDQRPEEDP